MNKTGKCADCGKDWNTVTEPVEGGEVIKLCYSCQGKREIAGTMPVDYTVEKYGLENDD